MRDQLSLRKLTVSADESLSCDRLASSHSTMRCRGDGVGDGRHGVVVPTDSVANIDVEEAHSVRRVLSNRWRCPADLHNVVVNATARSRLHDVGASSGSRRVGYGRGLRDGSVQVEALGGGCFPSRGRLSILTDASSIVSAAIKGCS